MVVDSPTHCNVIGGLSPESEWAGLLRGGKPTTLQALSPNHKRSNITHTN